jgi:rhodanese-related sulfurtransferase
MPEQKGLLRDVLVIVATGIVLGLAHNQLALAGRPPRGLAWIARPEKLESVESIADSTVVDTTLATSTTSGAGVASPSTATSGHATRSNPTSSPSPSDGAGSRATGEGTTEPRPPSGSATAGLPVIPQSSRPLAIELANVKKFVDARAAVLIDAREADEFAAGHIPGAINISIDDAAREPEKLEKLDAHGMPIIVYCGGGDCEASRMLAESLMRDYLKKRVLVFEGGFPGWSSAGYPVAK